MKLFFLISLILLVFVSLTSSETNPVTDLGCSYTGSTETCCKIVNDRKVCSTALYSGTMFVYEDNEWKGIEEVKSLKNVWNKVYLEKDSDFDIEVIGINFTDLELNFSFDSSNWQDYPECADSKENDIKCDFKLTRKETVCNETDCWKEEEKFQYKYQEKDGIKETLKYTQKDSPLKYTYTFGGNSTTIKLQDNVSENLDDSYVHQGNGNTNYGTETKLVYYNYNNNHRRTYIRFNISSIPSGQTIDEAKLFLYEYIGDDLTNIYMYHVYNHTWTEDVITWNNQPCGTGFDDSTNCNLTEEMWRAGETGIGLWHNWTATVSVKKEYDDGDLNVSFAFKTFETVPVSGVYGYWYSKEYATDPTLRPYLNITYSEAVPEDTCTPPASGNYANTCSDNCTWTDNDEIPANWTMTGAGHQTLSANFTFTGSNQYIFINSGCTLEIESGGRII